MTANPPRRAGVVAREPIHEQILPHIRRDIVEGRWPPGERLPEPLLCAEFGISRTPLRDALKLLEAEGLVDLLPHVGAVVTDPSPPDVAEKMEVLGALEQAAAARLARLRRPQAIERIVELHEAMKRVAHENDAAAYYRLNDDFHRAIVMAAGNRTLAAMHEQIMWHVHRARHRANRYEKFEKGAARHHERIVRAIVAGDPARASQAMAEHLHEVGVVMVGHAEP